MNAYEIARAEADGRDCQKRRTAKAVAAGELPAGHHSCRYAVETPKDSSNGDWASTFAMQCAKPLHMAPRKIAEAHRGQPRPRAAPALKRLTIARPRLYELHAEWQAHGIEQAVRGAIAAGKNYGRTHERKAGKGHGRVRIPPTRPARWHMGNARGGVLGDRLSSVLDWAGSRRDP